MADAKPAQVGAWSRWSRRKAAASDDGGATEDARTTSQQQPTQQQPVVTADAAEKAAKSPPTDEDMPPLASLNEDSDFSGFLSPGVSEGLRKAALRKLFRSAGFNLRDGLDDYDDDFRSFTALGDLITSDMKHQMERAEARRRERMAEDDDAEMTAEHDERTEKDQSEEAETETKAETETNQDADGEPMRQGAPES